MPQPLLTLHNSQCLHLCPLEKGSYVIEPAQVIMGAQRRGLI